MPVEVGPQNPFKYILIAGPDKLGIASFIRMIRNSYPGIRIGDMHNLMSEESLNEYWEEFQNRFEKGIVSYYAKKCINVPDPLRIIPSCLRDIDLILWFELYAEIPVVLKTSDVNASERFIEMWKALTKGG